MGGAITRRDGRAGGEQGAYGDSVGVGTSGEEKAEDFELVQLRFATGMPPSSEGAGHEILTGEEPVRLVDRLEEWAPCINGDTR